MNTKICKDCKQDLELSNFSDRHATCNACRNEKKRKLYHEKKKKLSEQKRPEHPLTSIERLLAELSIKIHNGFLNRESKESLGKTVLNFNLLFEKFIDDNDILRFPIVLPDALHTYLTDCKLNNIHFDKIMQELRSKTDPVKFEQQFGASRDSLADEIHDELESFVDVARFLQSSYNHWINTRKNRVYNATSDRTIIQVYYEPQEREIILSNPFGLSFDEFMKRLDTLVIECPESVRPWISYGCYDHFKNFLRS